MKVIGRIEPKLDDEGYVIEDAEYLGGIIVKLTAGEARVLRELQEACKGNGWSIERMISYDSKPADGDMYPAFGLVWRFVEAKFAVNEFKARIADLEEAIGRLSDPARE